MADTNPLPASLAHLQQRDAAIRLRALEEARQVCIAESRRHQANAHRSGAPGYEVRDELSSAVAAGDCVAAIRSLMERPTDG